MLFYSFYGVFEFDEGGYLVLFFDLKGCLICGDDMEEVLIRVKVILEGYLLEYEDLDKGIFFFSFLEIVKVNIFEDVNVIFVEINIEDLGGIERF